MIPDPGVVIDYNRYAYVRANPMKYQDPSGNFVETLWDAANVGIGIASLATTSTMATGQTQPEMRAV